MKRFLLFQYCDYYPGGGMKDYAGQFDTLEEAKTACDLSMDNWDILDTQEHKWYSRYRVTWPKKSYSEWIVN